MKLFGTHASPRVRTQLDTAGNMAKGLDKLVYDMAHPEHSLTAKQYVLMLGALGESQTAL